MGNGGSELELVCLEKSMVEMRKRCHFQGELCAALGQGNRKTKEHFWCRNKCVIINTAGVYTPNKSVLV